MKRRVIKMATRASDMHLLNVPLSQPHFFDPHSAWLRHGPFGMWLVHALRPRRIVELGTHYGFSYFCFCQAVAAGDLATECFAVDTWQGDEHAGFYGEEIYHRVMAHNQQYVRFSRLLRKTFTEALDDIEDSSVDLLHVDGRHFYHDVKADFENWIPKLSPRSVVLFHDTEVREHGFGVWQYWAELAAIRPSLNFPYQHGLGMLFWGKEIAEGLAPLARTLTDTERLNWPVEYFALAGESYVRDATQRGVIERLELAEATIEERKAETVLVQQKLQEARRRPLKQLKRKLVFNMLRAAAKASPPLPSRTAERFRRSAAKRDPMRDDLQTLSGQGFMTYEAVVRGWGKQRQALAGRLSELVRRLQNGPLISVVVPVYNPDPALLVEMIESVRAQSYANWELCLADDCSTDPEVGRVLRNYAAQDPRVRVVFREANGHMSQASNSAIEIARGAYIALLDHDDLLDPDALVLVVQVIDAHPDAKIIYTDEDKIVEGGTRCDAHFKPDWNRDLLYGINYISHLGVFDAALVREVGAFREGFEGAQDYDMLLRCIERVQDRQIHHIAKVLYSWRATPGSAAASNRAKPYANEAGRRALEEHLARTTGKSIPVVLGPIPFSYRALWPMEGTPLVSIIIPTRDHLNVLRATVESILGRTMYGNFELIVVDNGSVEADTLEWFGQIEGSDRRVRVLRDARPFNYSALNNAAVAQSRGEIVALVNDDVEVIAPDWLSEMVALAQRPGVGCVGAKLYYPDGRIQHAGVVIGLGGVAGHGHLLYPGEHAGYFCRLKLRQNYSAVTAACLVIKREIFDAVGGLNESELTVAFSDIDLCLKVRAAGYNNVWTPWAELYHHESASRGHEDTPEKRARFRREVDYMKRRWKTHDFADPAYNPNLALERNDFVLSSPRWCISTKLT